MVSRVEIRYFGLISIIFVVWVRYKSERKVIKSQKSDQIQLRTSCISFWSIFQIFQWNCTMRVTLSVSEVQTWAMPKTWSNPTLDFMYIILEHFPNLPMILHFQHELECKWGTKVSNEKKWAMKKVINFKLQSPARSRGSFTRGKGSPARGNGSPARGRAQPSKGGYWRFSWGKS